jgi:SAM-dependent methyltransferase
MVTTCACPVCEFGKSEFFASIDGYDYLQCGSCRSLHIACDVLDDIDRGSAPRLYDEDYWREELRSARERASGVSLVRAGEAILYCRRPVTRFLDVGTGPGYLLDELAKQFPTRQDVFHGVELFPPEEHSSHPNYMRGDVGMLDMTFDAGVCIEVIEHLTPRMLAELARGLARVSTTGTLWLFNTGMPDYVLNEDRGYLDPLRRGHIVSYSLPGLAHIFEPHGLRVQALPGKSFAFVAEFQPDTVINDFEHRIYRPLAENTSLLQESGLLHQAAFESARAYLYYSLYLKKAISSPTRGLLRRSAHSMLPAFMRRRK